MNLNITTSLAEVRSRLSGLEKQVNFAAAPAVADGPTTIGDSP